MSYGGGEERGLEKRKRKQRKVYIYLSICMLMLFKKRVLIGFLAMFLIFSLSFVLADFDVSSVLLKVSVQKGGTAERMIKINSEEGGEFRLDVNLEGVSVGESSFVLQKGETKDIRIYFDSSSVAEGVYVGHIAISGSGRDERLPVIFEVESRDVFFDSNLNIPQQYVEVLPGGKLVAEIKIFDLVSGGTTNGLSATNIDVEYHVYDIYGSEISSESESVVIDKQTQITKTLSIPKDIERGQYVFGVSVKHSSSVGTSSQVFNIGNREISFSFGKFDGEFFAILIIVVIFLLGLVLLFIYLLRDRDRLFLGLKKHNTEELKRQKELLLAQARVMRGRGISRKRVEREVKKNVTALKDKQKKRIEEMRKLKEAGDVKKMKKKLNEWKKKGYNTLALEYKLKGLSTGEMKNLLKKWKKEYQGEK